MKRNQTLFSKKLEKLKEGEYYRQRFDACPHFMFSLGIAHTSSIQNTQFPFGQKFTMVGFANNVADWLHPIDELEKTRKQLQNELKKNPELAQSIIKSFEPFSQTFYTNCNKIKSTSFAKVNDQQLIALHQELINNYTNILNASPLIDGHALMSDEILVSEIQKVVQNTNKEFASVFESLTAPTFNSFLQEEKIDLIKVYQEIKKQPDKESQLTKEHQEKYFWIQNNYVDDTVLQEEYFRNELNKIKNPQKLLNELKENLSNKDKKKKLASELNISKTTMDLIFFTDVITQLQDQRKKATFYATHYLSKILNELANRTQYSLNDLKWVFPPEIKDIFSQLITLETINQRKNGCLLYFENFEYDVTTNQKTVNFFRNFEIAYKKELKGIPACLGVTNGPVKILNSAKDIDKVQEGDILIAVMTRPDYLPAMDKAAAFVTDEGGVTCHAAIVAREMQKPCIIATKKATQTFKDNQLVKVDANKGTITLIK